MVALPCGYCRESFQDTSALLNHVEANHQAEQEQGEAHECLYNCYPCQLQFRTEGDLTDHITEAHSNKKNEGDEDDEEDEVEEEEVGEEEDDDDEGEEEEADEGEKEKEKNSWRCDICGKSFAFRTRLLSHCEVHRPLSERERSHACADCASCFLRRADLVAHERTVHMGAKRQCPICGKRLAGSGALHNHLATHDRRRICNICGKRFALKQKLEAHLLGHAGKKPFECEECGVGFVHKQSWEAHQRKNHSHADATQKELLTCAECAKPFLDGSSLKRHLRWHNRVRHQRKQL